jgi:hypothetical protein
VICEDHASARALGGARAVSGALVLPLPEGLRPHAREATPAPAHEPHVWTATGLERQIFLDQTGRRARRARIAGVAAAALSTGWLAALVTGAVGFASLPAVPSAGALAARGHRVSRPATAHQRRHRSVAVAQLTSTVDPGDAHQLARGNVGQTAGTVR